MVDTIDRPLREAVQRPRTLTLVRCPEASKGLWSMGWFQGKGSYDVLPSWSRWNRLHEVAASKPRRVGLHEMVRGLGGRNARQVDGCRESEVSREWLIGDTIYGSGMGSMPRKSQGRGDATGARSGSPCQAVLYYKTQLAFGPDSSLSPPGDACSTEVQDNLSFDLHPWCL